MERTINCSILTPEGALFDGAVNLAVIQAHNGEMGFMYNHSPLISELGIGEIRLSDTNGTKYLVVEGGIVEIRDNKIIILAENAYKKEDLDVQELEARLKELDSTETEPFSDENFLMKIEETKIRARIKVANR